MSEKTPRKKKASKKTAKKAAKAASKEATSARIGPHASSGDTSHELQREPSEVRYADELTWLAAWDAGPRPPGWRLTPRAVVTFVRGSEEPLSLEKDAGPGLPRRLSVAPKFVGSRSQIERAVVTLAGERGLLLVGEPGTAKSLLSELLAAAICGTSALTVQGTAGTSEEQLRYGWNYSLLIAKGPHEEALVPAPVLRAMRRGAIARIEEITRCLPEVQDALISILSERRLAIPELEGPSGAHEEPARAGFNVIATANLRDRGVSEMSSALKRRFNFEVVEPIADLARETALVRRQTTQALECVGQPLSLDDALLEAVVTAFRDLRAGTSAEGWSVERPTSVMSTAEAVGVATSLGLQSAFLGGGGDPTSLLPGYLLGVVQKDEPKDRARLLAYWDGCVKRRAEAGARLWKRLYELRAVLEEVGAKE